MNIKEERLDDLNSLVTIELAPADYMDKVDKSIKDQSKKVKIPGFRDGMVPVSHVKKMFGKDILVDEINHLLSHTLQQYISEHSLKVLGQPLSSPREDQNPRWDFEDNFEFSYEIGLSPEVNIDLNALDGLVLYEIEISQEMLDQRVTAFRNSLGTKTSEAETEPAPLDVSLFDRIFPGKEIRGEVEFFEKVREEMVQELKVYAESRFDAEIIQKIAQIFPSPLPDAFLKKWLKAVNEKKLDDGQIDERYPDFQKNLKWTLVENQLFENNRMQIAESEVVQSAREKLTEQFRRYSMQPLSEVLLDEYANNYIRDEKHASRLAEEIKRNKVLAFIKATVTPQYQTITLDDFEKLPI